VRYLIHKSRITFAVMKAGRVLFAQRHTDWTKLVSTLTGTLAAQHLRRDLIDDQIAVALAELETTGAPPGRRA
jgi:hypothetical protein